MTAYLEVDVTGWTITQLSGVLTARVGAEAPADLAAQVPFVRVARAGGPDDGMAIDAATMVFHCFAVGQPAANELAHTVRAALRDLRGVAADGAVLTLVRKLGGPLWASYENTTLRQSVLTMQLRVKAA